MSEMREMVKKVPGVRDGARAIRRLRANIRRMLVAPTRAELYDIQTLAVMRKTLRRDSNCVDVGAHLGQILLDMLWIAPRGRHYAIEALPHLAEGLRNDFPTVEVLECAVSNENGEQLFNFVENAPGYSGLRERRYATAHPEIRRIPVSVQKLDDIIPADANIDFIKMDIEGGEYNALRGGRETLLRCKPVVVFEFGLGAADYYDVTPAMMYDYLHGEIGLNLSTMERVLGSKPAFSKGAFQESFEKQGECYFVAYPDMAA